jgi:hypothetical protein
MPKVEANVTYQGSKETYSTLAYLSARKLCLRQPLHELLL